jgi:hypothetical protein
MLKFTSNERISMKRNILISLVLACAFSAQAGPYTDTMSKCFTDRVSTQDKTALARWMFIAFGLNPDVAALVNVTDKERESINRAVAEIFKKLVIKSCRKEAIAAVQHEGQFAMEDGFRLLGEAAFVQLMGNPKVSKGLHILDLPQITQFMKEESNF